MNPIPHEYREHHITERAQFWLATTIGLNGRQCGNCGAFRQLSGREIKQCFDCKDDAYDIYEVAYGDEELP